MGQPKALNIAMVGYGLMGRAHSNAFHPASHFFMSSFNLKLKTICGRNQANLGRILYQWSWEETASKWEEVVHRKDIDVVDICTPNYLHEPIAVAAAKAGKIVLCEKPLANSVVEAERIMEASRNVSTLVWFNYRRVPAITLARQLIEQGKMGETYHYRALYLQSLGAKPGRSRSLEIQPPRGGLRRYRRPIVPLHRSRNVAERTYQ
jgi:predicted dehydrogenase